jgi:hypothetical protein
LPGRYYVIIGASGVGKTTAVLEAINKLPRRNGAKGVVYYNVNSGVDALSGLCKAINLEMYFEEITRWNWRDVLKDSQTAKSLQSPLRWGKIQPILIAAAEKFKNRHGFLPALVLDTANIIASKDSALLGQLQDFAKLAADNNTMRVFFVSSDSSTLLMLRSRSGKRASVFQVHDISDDRAVEYLVSSGVPPDLASDAVSTITGGRFTLLNEYLHLRNYMSNEEILSQKFRRISSDLVKLNVDCSNKVFDLMARGQTVASSMFRVHGISQDVLQKLVASNILLNLDEGIYFESRSVQHFFSLWNRKSDSVLELCGHSAA